MVMMDLQQTLVVVVRVLLEVVVLVGLVHLVKVQRGAMAAAIPVMGVVVAAAHLRLVQTERRALAV
jgi:hypothetical protein